MSGIKEVILHLIKQNTQVVLIPGVVKSVNKSEKTCTIIPLDDSADFIDVKLKPIVDSNESDNGIVLYPAKNSYVIVGCLNGDDTNTIIIEYSKIDSVSIKVGKDFNLELSNKGELKINAKKTVFNNGKNGGLAKVKELTKKINNLESKVDSMIVNLQKPAALGVPVDAITQPILVQTTEKELSNDLIEH
jgi:hypothetical protein